MGQAPRGAALVKPPKVERPRLAVVRWRDTHAHDGGWQTVAEVAGSSAERLVVSVGWVLPWGTLRDHLTIAQDYDAITGCYNGISHLLFKGAVLSWRFLD